LKEHILARLGLEGEEADGSFSNRQRNQVYIYQDRLFNHKVCRLNYTTYDFRRGQDRISSRTCPNIMVLAGDDDEDHPYAYAQSLAIFHCLVCHPSLGNLTKRFDFMWVRWYERDRSHEAGWVRRRLHRLKFVNIEMDNPFGFVDPNEIVRAAHLIPAFAFGRTNEYLGRFESVARLGSDEDDWRFMYVNM
jgi:hypothetical protein